MDGIPREMEVLGRISREEKGVGIGFLTPLLEGRRGSGATPRDKMGISAAEIMGGARAVAATGLGVDSIAGIAQAVVLTVGRGGGGGGGGGGRSEGIGGLPVVQEDGGALGVGDECAGEGTEGGERRRLAGGGGAGIPQQAGSLADLGELPLQVQLAGCGIAILPLHSGRSRHRRESKSKSFAKWVSQDPKCPMSTEVAIFTRPLDYSARQPARQPDSRRRRRNRSDPVITLTTTDTNFYFLLLPLLLLLPRFTTATATVVHLFRFYGWAFGE